MVFGCGSIKSGPILEYPLVEHNSERHIRPVYLNIRKVKGKRGWLLRHVGRYLMDDTAPEAMGHHALQIGGYAYELHTDEANQKYLMVQRLTGDQIWEPQLAKAIVGYCDLTDDEIAIEDGYAPNLYFNAAFTVGFAISALVFSHQAFIWKNWKWFSITLCVGCLMESGGYIGRILLHNNPFSDIGFKLNIIFLTIAPAFISAGIYLTLKQMTRVFGSHLSRLSPSMYAWIFVVCDGISIILQGSGGAISAIAESDDLLNTGVDLMIAGLAFQVFTLTVFFVLAMEFLANCMRNPEKMNPGSIRLVRSRKFQLFLAAVSIAFLCIFCRCCYRVAELSGGWGSKIMKEEAGFIICDSDMCTVAAIVLNIIHPGYFFKEQIERIMSDEKGDAVKSDEDRHHICSQCRRMRPHEEYSMSKVQDGYGKSRLPVYNSMPRGPVEYSMERI
ncbi:hypothetical protein LTR08_002763 [Meristemomyces frigidus]|nr:hypothetical protein LTR08_002763 [Meristemomyces frigidus]